ncbi:hypothetical protein [Streptomyces chartreusis]|uniref:Uncharacterized protein n=1 Tax=Streptomyces chartreusis TaxID=1969 RepID=A0A7H8T0Q2_STRCX|nr:hypothetical protein [Streptomyces chartreusis]QKZ17053.1 hypothetical protein HUT05_06535 [Streptomyces chartreusis]
MVEAHGTGTRLGDPISLDLGRGQLNRIAMAICLRIIGVWSWWRASASIDRMRR